MTPSRGYIINLSGRRFGMWIVLCFYGKDIRSHGTTWLCKCICGTVRPVKYSGLMSGKSTSCGCPRKGWIEKGIGYIPLTQGLVALVSPSKVSELEKWNWQAVLSKSGKFYARRYAPGSKSKIPMSRHIMDMNSSDLREVDHINLDTLDNRDENLRIATKIQNLCNKRVRKDSETGFKGVAFDKRSRTYYAYIGYKGKRIWLGSAATAEDTHKLYVAAAIKLQGEFARTS